MANHWKTQQQQAKREDLMTQCKQLISAGKCVEAVKLYRSRTGADLRRAMVDLKLDGRA